MIYSFTYAFENKITVLSNNRFLVTVQSLNVKYTEKKLNKFTLRQYQTTSNSGTERDILPSRNIILAIPPEIEPTFKVTDITELVYENTIPVKDITKVELSNVDESSLKKNFSENKIEIARYFWFREFFCVEIKINTHEFDPAENRLKEVAEIKIEADLGSYTLVPEMPIQVISHYDKILSEVIYNSSIAGQFKAINRETIGYYDDSWIYYSKWAKNINHAEGENQNMRTLCLNSTMFSRNLALEKLKIWRREEIILN